MIDIQKILIENSNKSKEAWTRRIINTAMPMYVVQTSVLRMITKEILRGDYREYLENEKFEYYENTIIYAKVLSKEKDFEVFKKYLYKYIPYVDNWASCDCFEFRVNSDNFEDLFKLSIELIDDSRTFARRIGVLIWFKMLNSAESTLKIFEQIKKLKNEQEYYVNMCVAWFLCDAFIKQRELAMDFLKGNNVNDFVLAKTVSKCCDSFRVSSEDKLYLKQLKKSL